MNEPKNIFRLLKDAGTVFDEDFVQHINRTLDRSGDYEYQLLYHVGDLDYQKLGVIQTLTFEETGGSTLSSEALGVFECKPRKIWKIETSVSHDIMRFMQDVVIGDRGGHPIEHGIRIYMSENNSALACIDISATYCSDINFLFGPGNAFGLAGVFIMIDNATVKVYDHTSKLVGQTNSEE